MYYPANDLPVPGQKYTFGIVKAAQARGDFQVLAERNRRALRVHLGADVAAGLETLQRAIQQRAQESVERERDLDQEERRPKPLKWLIIAAIASIPVILTLTAVDGFLRAFYSYMDVAAKSAPVQTAPAPPSDELLQSNEPGVILLQPLNETAPPLPMQAVPSEPAPTKN